MREGQGLIDDMMTLGGTLLGHLVEARHEVKAQVNHQAENWARKLNLVSREEFDAAFAMLAKARVMQEDLSDRLRVIEAKLGLAAPKPAAKATPKKPKARLPLVKKLKTRRA